MTTEVLKQFKKNLTVKNEYIYSNGKYTGETYKGVKQGKGVLEMNDGFIYMGYFKDNMPNGLAAIIYPNGEKYEG